MAEARSMASQRRAVFRYAWIIGDLEQSLRLLMVADGGRSVEALATDELLTWKDDDLDRPDTVSNATLGEDRAPRRIFGHGDPEAYDEGQAPSVRDRPVHQ